MTEVLTLLDSPKRNSLESQSAAIRIALKDFERRFACNHNGQKPSKADIKADQEIAVQYKAYNRIRDVLKGTISYEDFVTPAKSAVKHERLPTDDNGCTWTSQQPGHDGTPRRTMHPAYLDCYDMPRSASPKPVLLSAIGPTPQRDGKIIGLFDTIPRSSRSSTQLSPASRKRKAYEICDNNPQGLSNLNATQTPSHRRIRSERDLLDHLTGTPTTTPHTGRRNQVRTPISDGRKFMLSQFFATPSVAKFDDTDTDNKQIYQTPLRDRVLGLSPRNKVDGEPDATPAYLKRSTSFKDRLMFASTRSIGTESKTSPPLPTSGGPPTLRHLKSAPKALSQIIANLRSLEDGNFDDDLEALHEIEDPQNTALVNSNDQPNSLEQADAGDENHASTRVWKKKGQKRTTKRTRIRPSIAPKIKAPKFVTAEDDEDHDNKDSTEEDSDYDADVADFHARRRTNSHLLEKPHSETASSSHNKRDTTKKVGTINPNAQSHMNFRSLKIRNKNSKAKRVGRGKFSRRR